MSERIVGEQVMVEQVASEQVSGEQDRAPRVARLLQVGQLRLAMLALLVMMLVTVADVTLRYVLGRPIHGAYDIVEVCLAVFVFHGMAAAFFNRGNIAIDLIDTLVGERTTRALVRVSDVITVAVLALVLWAMVYPAVQAFEYGDKKLELGLPIYYVWIPALAGMAGTLLCAVSVLFRRVVLGPGAHR